MKMRLIQSCYVLDQDAPSGYLRQQNILIEGDKILAVRPTGLPVNEAEVIDGENLLVIPGLINAHTHSPENVLRGTSERIPLEPWLVMQFADMPNFSREMIYLMTLAGAGEMLRSGTTAVLDHFVMFEAFNAEGIDAAMRAYDVSGMRAALSPMLEDRDLTSKYLLASSPELAGFYSEQDSHPSTFEQLELMRDFLDRWHGASGGRLRGLPGLGGLQWCSPQLLDGSRDLARQFNTGIHMHLNETRLQAQACRSVLKRPAVLELERLGIMDPANSFAHAVWMEQEELDILARSKAIVVHNPVSNLKLGSGIAKIPAMLDLGIPVGLGADGAASNDNQNMFSAMKITGLIHSPAVERSARWLSARDVFSMATVGGARAIGFQGRLGLIKEGYLADLTLLDLNYAFHNPSTDAFQYLVFCETGSAVRHVLVGGEWAVKDGRVMTFREEEVLQELAVQMKDYFRRSGKRDEKKTAALVEAWRRALDKEYSLGGKQP